MSHLQVHQAQREHNPTANDSADDQIKNIGIRDGMYGRKIDVEPEGHSVEGRIAAHSDESCMPGEISDFTNQLFQAIVDYTPALTIMDKTGRHDLIGGASVD